jgi:hypothetical protein
LNGRFGTSRRRGEMSKRQLLMLGWLSLLLLVTGVLTGCGAREGSSPRVWIDAPLNSSQHEWGTIQVMSHSSCEGGIREVALLVNGEEYRRDESPDSNASLVTIVQPWVPPSDGQYTLQVIAYTRGRVASDPATVRVTIGSPPGTPLPTVAHEAPTPPPAEATWVVEAPSVGPAAPTSTPQAPVATWTPVPPPPTLEPALPTSTPRRAEIAYFEAYPSNISAGGCTTLRWGVEYATEVYLDGDGAGDHETRQVCPQSTTTYTLLARSPGGEAQSSITVTVAELPTPTPAPDSAGPEITNVERSADVIYFPYPNCGPVLVTFTTRVSDPSGVDRVRLVYSVDGGGLQVKDMSPAGGQSYQVELKPSQVGIMEYWIRAWDTLGNRRDGGRATLEVKSCG